MGRSKFPGKPSKHIHRKRVNVLPPTGEISNVETNGSMTVECVVENKQEEDLNENDGESKHDDSVVNKKVSIKRRLTRKMKSSLRNKNASNRNLLSKICNKNTTKPKINKGTRTSLKRYSTTCRSKAPKEATNLVGKFVLPTRSVHSSRVIKPNKRFLSDLNDSLTLKKKVSIKRHCVKQNDDKSQAKTKTKCNESGSFNSDSDKTTFTNGHRVVLRQARLKLPNQIGTQGPFSTKPNGSPPGTVTCGVCGAVRFYRFVKQARKFNIYSCESCRKFITKIIKRQACGGKSAYNTLVCNKGHGTCHISPAVRCQQWKLTKCAYRARCTACWLKMCLRAFHMPHALKQSLGLMLPKNMQGVDVVFNSALPPLLWQANVESKLLVDKHLETTTVKQRPVRYPKTRAVSNPLPVPNTDVKRQKIDLKGPRVKHVCRSASIVLGQPLAIFGEPEKKCDRQEQSADPKPAEEKLNCDKVDSVKNKLDKINKMESASSETESNTSEPKLKMPISVPRSNNSIMQCLEELKPPERKKNLTEPSNGISIDFWDSYDPECISENGFCVIGSEQFTMAAICYVCGSAGLEAMLYCLVCCEPYHPFCLEDTQTVWNSNPRSSDGSWVCPRCTECGECNQADRLKVTCQKCLKVYHPECFNSRWDSTDKPTVCSRCLRCKGCGNQNITKFIGNLPLCIACFKLQKKGNFCPICQYCYDENECCSKMMECAKCNKWVHAKCESLTEEQYQLLSILPESIEYFCSVCTKKPYWRKAINEELRSSFSQVLRLLSRNKTARNLLKWSPLNNSTPSNRAITNVRKLQFSEDNADLDNNNDSTSEDINKIFLNEENGKLEELTTNDTLSIIDIKNKINSNNYSSVREFNKDIEEALKATNSIKLLDIYKVIFYEVFPWFRDWTTEEEPAKVEAILKEKSQIGVEKNDLYAEIVSTVPDTRICGFCKVKGDKSNREESRLLYCGLNEWVHANCALWSSEVYEEIDGSLQNVQAALNRGRLIRCSCCGQKGASIGCCYKGCHETFHFRCAKAVKMTFLQNRSVYCSEHELNKNVPIIENEKDFEIHRSIYVELDSKKRKYCEISKVSFMSGSLRIKNLGKIHLPVSDGVDAIIPLGFVCSRLFWSTVEPWKLVPYTITTSMRNGNNASLILDKNFTVDHSMEKTAVEKIMKQLNVWQRDLDRRNSDTESEDDEEQQNGADILSPELTDAILEELPHDLLDGISVQDIFPKFSYDDLITMDYKNELSNLESITDVYRRSSDVAEDSDTELIKRNKPELNKVDAKNRPPQRSCSLTLSCKLDSALSPAVKKRKMVYHILQVDGNCDDTSSSECSSPTGIESNPWAVVSEQPVTCEKCQCTYRTQASYKRHLDSCDALCTSESESEIPDQETMSAYASPTSNSVENTMVMGVNVTEPVVISSYESFQSEIHTSVLNTQSYMTPGTEMVLQSMPQVEQKSMVQSITPTLTIEPANTEAYTINQPTITIGDLSSNQGQFCVNQTVPLCVNQPLALQQSYGNQLLSINSLDSLSQPNSLTLNQLNQPSHSISFNHPGTVQQPLDFHQHQPVTIQSVPILSVGNQNQFPLATQWVKQVKPAQMMAQKTMGARARSRTIAAKPSGHLEEGETIILPQSSAGQVITYQQHLPSANYVPTFVDAFQQPAQNLQYVTAIAPQMNTMSTQSLLQIQPDNSIISIVPGLQPTMYIQQPRVLENQLVVEGNGAISWPQPTVQPVYYGFETIVQNTVMQSQQFLPTTVPGVLTANSSYSTTTQVFQTSKLEPVLDVSSNSFVLVNGQLVNSQPLVNSQSIVNSQPLVNSQPVIHSQPLSAAPMVESQTLTQQPIEVQYSEPHINVVTDVMPRCREKQKYRKTNNISAALPQKQVTPVTNGITLPTAPFVLEPGIPTNVVTPIPKPPTSMQSRPMSRVLPMPTINFKECKKIVSEEAEKKICLEEKKRPMQIKVLDTKVKKAAITTTAPKLESKKFEILECKIVQPALPTVRRIVKRVEEKKPLELSFEKAMPSVSLQHLEKLPKLEALPELKIPQEILSIKDEPLVQKPQIDNLKTEDLKIDTSLKIVFQKQGQDGSYKISNNFSKQPVQVAPLKPMKSLNYSQNSINLIDKEDKFDEKTDNKFFADKPKPQTNKKDTENGSSIIYTIETQDGYKYTSNSVLELWSKVLEAVQTARAAHNMPPLPTDNGKVFNSLQILGLKSNGLKYLIEQLPGASKCSKYKSLFNFPQRGGETDDDLSQDHIFGSIRCAPFQLKDNEPFDMFGWLSSKHRQPEEISIDTLELLPRRVINLPMAMKFRQLKLTSKYSVGVYRSCIHGRGLFCLIDIEAGEMVIEYAGEVIRSILTDKREKYYNSKGIGCYMFRVDDNFVVDATMRGNAARFINHSCDPNCYSRVVEILGHKHIIIFALRRILSGEELTYDYKFPFEEDKIPCTCGSKKCRKFLN